MHIGPFTSFLDSRTAYVHLRPRAGLLVGIFLVIFVAASACVPLAVSHADQTKTSRIQSAAVDLSRAPKYKPDKVLVRFRPGVQRSEMEAAHQQSGAKILSEPAIVHGLHIVQLGVGVSLESALKNYRGNKSVLYAEPDYLVHASGAPNDPQFPAQWNLQNTGQNGGTLGADIRAVQAWGITTGSPNTFVAVLDTGIDYTHQDLAANVWSAASAFSIPDQNGNIITCAASSHGLNAVAGTCDPQDDNGHGSHVSGIIGAVGNNNIGVAGVNWQVRILPCKILDATGAGDLASVIVCLDLVKQLKDGGLNIVATNNSWGGSDFSQALQDAIAAHFSDGILFIAAAGNDFSDNDEIPTYPANVALPNVISVSAMNRFDAVATFSNVGRRTVHLGAPGEEILSTTPNNTYSVFSGTSMAAPHVTGVAALLKAQDPSRDWRAIKNLILAGGDSIASLGQTITQRRLNAYGAMTCTNSRVQSRVLPVADVVSGSIGSPITLSFLNINCSQPAGNVTVQISPGGQTVTLTDDGTAPDQAAGDGLYSGQWTPAAFGNYSLTFPDGSVLNIGVLAAYGFVQTPYSYTTITGTNLNLGDDSVAAVSSPFPIQFGGGNFSQMFVSSNGTISFTDAYAGYNNVLLSPDGFPSYVQQPTTLIAPFWMDLFPVKGTSENVFWQVTGTAPNRQLVVEWRNVRSFLCRSDNSATITFEVVFREGSSDILFNYLDTIFGDSCASQDDGQTATIGVQPSPTSGVDWVFDFGIFTSGGTSILWQSPPPARPNNPVPVLASIFPSSAPFLSPDLTLTVTGSGFMFGSFVQWDRASLPTTYISSTQLTATAPATVFMFGSPYTFTGTANVAVLNPAPAGGVSNSLPFVLLAGTPSIISISPSSASAGGLSFVLDVKGNNLNQANIYWNSRLLQSFTMSNNEVTAAVPFGLIGTPGTTAKISAVVNGPGGGTSNIATFTIGPAAAVVAANAGSITHQSVDSTGKTGISPQVRAPMRFLGWNYGAKQGGPAYLKYFSRPYGPSPPVPRALTPQKSVRKSFQTAASNSVPSLSQPQSLPGFAFQPTLPAGFLPSSVTTGDFNRDGKMDWVVSNGGSNDLWLYSGNGDGAAQLPVIIPLAGASPLQVVAADLRGIGILDLVVAEADSGTVGILLGNGNGTFAPEVLYNFPAPVLCVAVADINGDGKLDLIAGLVGDQFTGPVATLLGDGSGKFATFHASPTDNLLGSFVTTSIVARDLNGDGLPDLVLVDQSLLENGVHSYLNRGDGTFKYAQFIAGSGGSSTVALGDVDEDGCVDAATTGGSSLLLVFKGNCDGSFQTLPNTFPIAGAGEAPVSIALSDMNGDGHLDVVTAGGFFNVDPIFGFEATNLVTVLLGDGKGNFSLPKVYRNQPSMYGLGLADLNGDGRPDVIAASQDDDSVTVLLNDSHGGLQGPSGGYIGYIANGQQGSSNAPYSNPFVQDLDGDGKPDLSLIEAPRYYYDPWEFTVTLNDGTGHFGPPIRSPVADGTDNPSGYVLGDFRNIGRPDLLVYEYSGVNEGNPALVYSANLGGGSFGPPKTTVLDTSNFGYLGILAVGDFNHDGKLDFLVSSVLPSNSSSASQGSQGLTVFLGNGDGTFRQGSTMGFGGTVPNNERPASIFVGDFNNDGKLDALVWVYDNQVGSLHHNLYEFLGNGDGTFAAAKLILPDFGFFTVADLNHDGLPDIVEYNEPLTTENYLQPAGVSIYLGQPDGTFKLTQTYQPYAGVSLVTYLFGNGSPDQTVSPLVADFNGDGNLDIGVYQLNVSFPNLTSYLQILVGNGDGTFTPTYNATEFHKQGIPRAAADVNGDGRADLIEIDGWPSSYHVILGALGPAIGLQLLGHPTVGLAGTVVVSLSVLSNTSTTVNLTTSDPNISIAPSVTIPAGSLSTDAPFTISSSYNAAKVFSLSAQLGSQTATVYSYETSRSLAGFRLFTNYAKETTAPSGITADYQVGVISMGGYSTTVQFACQGLPAGATCNFGLSPRSIGAGQQALTSLAIQTSANTPMGSYPVVVTANDGSISDQITITLQVSDFSMNVSAPSSTIAPGGSLNLGLTVVPIGGWTDSVYVSCQMTPSVPGGCNDLGSFPPGVSSVTFFATNMPVGNYSVTFSGTADGVSRSAPAVTIHVGGANGSVAPSAATISVGGSANFNVTLSSQNGYSEQFIFSCPTAAAGVICKFSPSTGLLPAGGTLISTLTVSVTSKPASTGIVPASPFYRGDPSWPFRTLFLLWGVLFVYLYLQSKSPGSRGRAYAAMAFASGLVLVVSIVAACGGGSAVGVSSGQPPPPTPQSATVTISVQASSDHINSPLGVVTVTVP